MTADPVTVLPETTLEAAVALMTEYGVHHLPVLDGPRVAGIFGYGRALAHPSHP
jgi:CBS domain-containing protein